MGCCFTKEKQEGEQKKQRIQEIQNFKSQLSLRQQTNRKSNLNLAYNSCGFQNHSSNILHPSRRILETVVMKKSHNNKGFKTLNNYTFLKTIGRGSYAKVKLAEKEDKFYAIKIMKKSFLTSIKQYYQDPVDKQIKIKDAYDDAKREIAIMKKVKHQNIVTLYEVIQNPDDDKLYLVMDYCEKGQVITWDEDQQNTFIYTNPRQKEPFSEDMIRKILRECIVGLHYLHQNGIIHRDIKPQNILMNKYGNIQICDFGISVNINRASQAQTLKQVQGTELFMPPEILDNSYVSIEEVEFKQLVDVWSLGVSLYSMVYMKLPFYTDNVMNFLKVIKNTRLKFPNTHVVSNDLKTVLSRMLEKNIYKRITLLELAELPWMNKDQKIPLIQLLEQNDENSRIEIQKQDLNQIFHISTIIKMKQFVRHCKLKLKNGSFGSLSNSQNKIKEVSQLENTTQTSGNIDNPSGFRTLRLKDRKMSQSLGNINLKGKKDENNQSPQTQENRRKQSSKLNPQDTSSFIDKSGIIEQLQLNDVHKTFENGQYRTKSKKNSMNENMIKRFQSQSKEIDCEIKIIKQNSNSKDKILINSNQQ